MKKKSTGLLSNWGTVEYSLLAIIIVLLCVAGALVIGVGSFFAEEEIANQATVAPIATIPPLTGSEPSTEADVSLDPTAAPGQPGGQTSDAASRTLTLSTPTGEPGTTLTVQGEGWPVGSRVLISLVPAEPPNYTVNSALVDGDGRFAAEMIVPSDARWLEESPVPVLAATEDGLSAQTSLTIVAPSGGQPVATPSGSNNVIEVGSGLTPNQPPPAETVAQLGTTANLNVRAGPGTTYPVLGVLTLGQKAEIIGRNDTATWWQIKFPGAPAGFGWVSAEFAQASNIGNVPIVNAPPPPVQPTPAPTATPQPGLTITDWRGEYFNNRDLQGPPVLVRNDVTISFDWALGSPDPSLPADNFSARWSRSATFSAGTYRFYLRADDGVRLWVDGALLIDRWKEQSPTTYAANIYLAEGSHSLQLEYNELAGGATAILSWNRVDTYPDWKAEYYNNPTLQGPPILVRNEGGINYNWGTGAPAPGLPGDNFSARWSRTSYFDGGDYLFRIISDDGHRVYFDNDLVLDSWGDGRTPVREVRRSVPAGLHEMRIEYYERGGEALIGFSWQRADRPTYGPQAIIRAPGDGLIGQPVKFDGRRSRPGDSALDKYDWDFGDGSTARGDNVSHTYRSPGQYRVRLTVTDRNGLRDRTSVDLKIEQDLQVTTPPLAVLDGPSTGSTGDQLNFNGLRSQSLSPIVDFQWNFGDGTSGRGPDIAHRFSRPGTYSIVMTLVAENGLRSSDNLVVRIDDPLQPAEAPVARITAPGQGQTNQPLTFDATRSTASHPMVSWQWSFGDGANANGLTVPHSYSAPGSYNVTLTVTDDQGQSNTANQLITIIDPPPIGQPPVPAISGPSQAAAGLAVTFDGSGSQSANPISAYVWDFGDGTTATGPQATHTFSQVGDFTVTLTVADNQGLQASTSQIITVTPKPQPQPLTANISGPTQGQVGQALTFDGQSSTSAAPLNDIQWDFGDGTTDGGNLVVNHVYQNPGNYTVLLTLANDLGQSNTTAQQMNIQAAPTANQPPQPVIQADAPSIEAGRTLNFDASGTIAGSPIVRYDWDFGDGTTGSGQLVSHDFFAPGSFDVTLTVTDQNGLSATTTQNIIVTPIAPPAPLMANISGPATVDAGQPVTLDGQGSFSSGPLTSIQWDFGDGATGGGNSPSDLVVSHSYAQPGTYTVQLTLTDDLNQTDTASFDLTVQPGATTQLPPPPPDPQPQPQPPTAGIEGPSQAAVGEAVLFDGGYSQASSPIVAYQWGFGDGSGAEGMGVTHAFAVPGSYNVTLSVIDENGLSSSASHTIEIVGQPAVQLPAEQPTPVPAPTPTPEPAQPEGQPTPEPTPEPQPTAPPTPEPPLARPMPAQPPTAVIDGPGQVQAGQPVNFSAASSQPGSSALVAYQWGLGDGTADNQAQVTHTFPAAGQYQVTLTVVDENGLSSSAQLLVSAGPSQAELDAQAAEEAQRQAEEEARLQAEAEAQRQAEEQAAQQQAAAEAEAEAQRQAEEEAQRQAAEEEARRQAEAEAQQQAEEEARRQAEAEAQRQAEEEAQRQAEEEARRQAEEAQQQAQEEQQQEQPDAPQDAPQDEAGDEGTQDE